MLGPTASRKVDSPHPTRQTRTVGALDRLTEVVARSLRRTGEKVTGVALYLVHPTFAPFGVSPALPLRLQKLSCGKIMTNVVLLEKPPRIPAR